MSKDWLHVVACLCALSIAGFSQSNSATEVISVRRFIAPSYPAVAWMARVQGTVPVDLTIKPDGTVDSVRLDSSHPLFRESVEKALREWLFQKSRDADVEDYSIL